MKLQPESKKELLRIAGGTAFCTVVLWVLFAALHLVGWVRFDYTVILGSLVGAAVAVGIQQGLLAEEVRVELPGGRLDIAWKGPGHPLYMTGPAAHVYDGFIHL